MYIVGKIGHNAQLVLSATPFTHTTLDSATTEAERLANTHPGTGFVVLRAVSLSVTERPPTPPAITRKFEESGNLLPQ